MTTLERPAQLAVLHDPSGLLEAIILNPEEDTPRLVYADWLDEHELHGRAEYIRRWIQKPDEEDLVARIDNSMRINDLYRELFQWCGFWTGIAEPVMDRGFIYDVTCSWEWWAKVGDALREREWVPTVKFTQSPPHGKGGIQNLGLNEKSRRIEYVIAGRSVWVHESEWLNIRGRFPSVDDFENRFIADLLTRRYPGTEFELPG